MLAAVKWSCMCIMGWIWQFFQFGQQFGPEAAERKGVYCLHIFFFTCEAILSGCLQVRQCTLDTVATKINTLLMVSWTEIPSSIGVSVKRQRTWFPTRLTSKLCSTNSKTSWFVLLKALIYYLLYAITTIGLSYFTIISMIRVCFS